MNEEFELLNAGSKDERLGALKELMKKYGEVEAGINLFCAKCDLPNESFDKSSTVSVISLLKELPQGVVVERKVDRNEIHNHAHAVLMSFIHQLHEVAGGAVAGGGAEKAGVLIAP